jgi:uroporphyrinogen-III synthase
MAAGPPRVLVTRAAEDAEPLVQAIAALGLQPVLVPLITRMWRIDAISDLAAASPDADWVVLTSATVIDVIATAAPHAWAKARFAAVGAQTARRAAALGYRVDVTTAGTGLDLATALGPVQGLKIALPRGDLAGDDLPRFFRRAGAEVLEGLAYENASPHDAQARLLAALPVDATTLLSGSAAQRLAAIVPAGEREKLGRIAVIGPSTRDVAQRAGLPVEATAEPHTAQGVVEIVARWFGR